jgi:putative (di)nucleoside polyphosphate hydrolase
MQGKGRKMEKLAMGSDDKYRRGVGIMLVNADKLVWVGRRIDNRDEAWQMPQGGLDKGEEPWAGALRELEEETGIAPGLVEKIADHPQQLRYDIPDAIAAKLWGGKWKGQVQDWFLARFTGSDADIDIATDHPEFSHWQWVEPHLLPELIVPFKRDMYRAILDGFADHLG